MSSFFRELLSSPDFPKEMYQEVGDRIEAYKGILKNVPAGPLRAVALHEGMEQAFREEIEEMKAIGEEPLKITCKRGTAFYLFLLICRLQSLLPQNGSCYC